MKLITNNRTGQPGEINPNNSGEGGIRKIKLRIFNSHRTYGRREDHLLRLALNEAEALAWQTGFPHLVFPVLAAEKAKSTVAWQKRQETLRPNPAEISLVA